MLRLVRPQLVFAIAMLLVAVHAQSGQQEMNMRQLEMVFRPCIVNDRCPRGLSYDMLKEQVPASYMLATYSAQFGGTPSACDCDRSDDRCNRRCYYALYKSMLLGEPAE
ncbi:hypothetical protein BOX15_Mlig007900g1 [Macrostomum lignano]|uniref:Uncharacterized protein n=1 Tax=Macrostomum lignano TaxID=282301 RepID=A0A267FI14_9PLAT|nr:hypothetical protein BOX15_Mlig007900g1 [Macrostomum lignano]